MAKINKERNLKKVGKTKNREEGWDPIWDYVLIANIKTNFEFLGL